MKTSERDRVQAQESPAAGCAMPHLRDVAGRKSCVGRRVGYTLPGLTFSVEHYRGSWIMTAAFPEDLIASEGADAMRAIHYWLASNRAKFAEGLRHG